MNTPFILNTVASTQQANRPLTPADSFSADVPFNQVLNKEVSNRNNDNRDKPREVTKEATPDPVKAGTPVASNQTAAAQSAQPAKSSDKDTTKKAEADEDGDDSDDSVDAASAQLLALVANLAQMPAKPEVKDSSAQAALAAQLSNAKTVVGQVVPKSSSDTIDAAGDDSTKEQNADFTKLLGGKEKGTDKPQAEAVVTDHSATAKKPVELTSANANAKPVVAQEVAVAAPRQTDIKATPELTVKTQEALPLTAVAAAPALQQAMALSQAQGSAMTKLAPTVGSPGWDQALGQKIVWMASGAQQSATLTLNPPDLGPLQVVLHVTNSHADAAFMTAQPEVKQALEAAMPKLREMLDQAGIQLGQATVSTGTPNQQHNTGGQTQSHTGRNTNAGTDSDIALGAAPAVQITSSGQGLVDTFA